MSVDLETNGLLGGSTFPMEEDDTLGQNGLLDGYTEPDLQENNLLGMIQDMGDDQMTLEMSKDLLQLETSASGKESQVHERLEMPISRTPSLPPSTTSMLAIAGPSRHIPSYSQLHREDTALRNAQALMMPRMLGVTAEGKTVSFGRKVRRKWDGVAVGIRYE
jgi:hypothetical protein